MHEGGFFYQAFVYLAAAVIAVPLAKRLGLGSVLGFLIAGIVIGPFGIGLVGEEGQDVMHFAEFGVIMMLFVIGLELQPSLLWELRISLLGMGGMQVGLTMILIFLISLAAGLQWQSALAIGMTLALSSTAIVLQTLNEKGLTKTEGGRSAFAVLLFQDIAVIPMLAVLPLLAVASVSGAGVSESHNAHSTWVDGLPVWGHTLAVIGVVAAIILSGKFIMGPVFRFIAKTRSREIFTAAALLLIIGIALLMTQVGLSPALGTFMAGVVLAGSEYRHELESDIDPFKGLLLGLFFLAVGASIDFALIASSPLLIALLVITLIGIKFIILMIIGKVFKLGTDNNLLFAFSLAQGGEFAFVLFSFAVQNNVVLPETSALLIAVVAITMALTPLLMLINEKLIMPHFGTKESVEKEADEIDEKHKVIIAGFGRFGSVVGRLLRANGVQATVLDIDSDNVEVLRKLGLKVFYGDASRYDLLEAAGAHEAKLLILAIDDPKKNLEMIETCRKHFPHIKILARASGRGDANKMIDAGIDHIYRETLDSSLKLGTDALRLLGFRSYQAYRAAKKFRKYDEKYLRELALLRHDSKNIIFEARQRINDLEDILSKEMEEMHRDKDEGWDITSLKAEFKDKK